VKTVAFPPTIARKHPNLDAAAVDFYNKPDQTMFTYLDEAYVMPSKGYASLLQGLDMRGTINIRGIR
jgi:hypothetical protein